LASEKKGWTREKVITCKIKQAVAKTYFKMMNKKKKKGKGKGY
jgi:hypothetical protein